MLDRYIILFCVLGVGVVEGIIGFVGCRDLVVCFEIVVKVVGMFEVLVIEGKEEVIGW